MFLTSGTKTTYDKHIVAPNRDWSAELYYYFNGTWRSLNATNLQSYQISDYSTDGSNITMGTVVGGKLTVNLVKVASAAVNRLAKGTEIKIKLTLNSPSATSSVTLTSGVFVIDDSKLTLRVGGSYNVLLTAYDFSYKMTDKFVASANSLTAKQMLTEIGNKYGFTIGSSVDDAIAEFESLYPTTFTPLADYTCKQTIGYMAGCYGSFAYFDNNLQLQFAWYENNGNVVSSNKILNGNSYVSEMEEREIVMLETGISSNPIVVPNNAKGFSINFENPYITQTQAESIYNKRIANGKIKFKIGKLSYRGNPLSSPGAIVSVQDINQNEFPFYIMKRTLRYDGGLGETIECQGESETTINYKLTSPTQQKINRALSKMEEAIKKATDIITQTKGSVFELIPIDESDPSKGNSGWKLYSTEIGSNNVILANSSGIGFSSNGGQSFNAAAIYIDKDGFGHINANFINVGELDGSIIKAGTVVVGKNEVVGLDAELTALLGAANEANNKADTASKNASDALSKATNADSVIADWCYQNDKTVIDGGKIYSGTITAEQIKAGSITTDKLMVGDFTNYNQVNLKSKEIWGFESVYYDFVTPIEYSSRTDMSSWYDYQNGLSFIVSGQIATDASYNGSYCRAQVTLRVLFSDNTEADCVENAGAGYVNGTSAFPTTNIKWVITPSKLNTSSKTVKKFKVVFRYANNVEPNKGKSHIRDIVVRAINNDAGTIVAGKLESVDGYTYFDLESSKLVAENSSGYSTALTAGGIVSSFGSAVSGGLQPLAVSGLTGSSQMLWFSSGLLIGEGQPTNNDPYVQFYDGSTTLYKPMVFMSGSGGITFYDTQANAATLSIKSSNSVKPCLCLQTRVFEIYNTDYPVIKFNNGSNIAELYLNDDGVVYISDAAGFRQV